MSLEPEPPSDDLKAKLTAWLDTEGYPLEFRTASAFRRAGFQVRQGEYVRMDSEAVREVDVAAVKTAFGKEQFVRVYHVVECKWTKDKPWIVFSGPGGISPSACVTQTFGSLLGESILWTIAGLDQLHALSLFKTPQRPGFNGRQAFSKGNDVFYNAMTSVTSLAKQVALRYDSGRRTAGTVPNSAVVTFPVIVIDGNLFEAWFDDTTNSVQLQDRKSVRLHWRGSPAWSLHATVDIVVADHLDEFARQRAEEVMALLDAMATTRDQIARCFEVRSLSPLEITKGGRGVVGLPPLLYEVTQMQRALAAGTTEAT